MQALHSSCRSLLPFLPLLLVATGCSDDPVAPVEPDPTPASVVVSPGAYLLEEGEGIQLAAEVRDAEGAVLTGFEVAWSSGDEAVAQVDAAGRVSGGTPGATNVTATVEGISDSAEIRVALEGTVVGPSGRTVNSVDGNVSVTLPPGAVAERVSIAIEPVEDGSVDPKGFQDGTAYRIGPAELALAQPARITLAFDPEGPGSELEAGTLRLHRADPDEGWALVAGSSVNLEESRVTGEVSGFTVFGVVATGPTPAVQVVAGHQHTCSLNAAGQAFCWGRGGSGELGNGSLDDSTEPVPVAGGHNFAELRAGPLLACGRRTDGEVWCWGRRLGAEGEAAVPEPLPGNLRFRTFAVGLFHGCGVDHDGVGHCWGGNTAGELGTGDRGPASPEPLAVAFDQPFESLQPGLQSTCGRTEEGEVHCWGMNILGALGNPDAPSPSLEPHPVAGDDRYRDLTAGAMNYCALTEAGTLRCWGRNDNGELADGTTESRSEPVPAAGGPEALDRVQAARSNSIWIHMCGLEQNTGTAWCWGYSPLGQVGPAAEETCGPFEAACSHVPVPIPGGLRFVDLAPGGQHTCGLTDDGDLFCWGSNAQGQFGNGTQADATEPVPGGTGGA
jgi:alpha-tubulin suppressor-like RCC1 family protein